MPNNDPALPEPERADPAEDAESDFYGPPEELEEPTARADPKDRGDADSSSGPPRAGRPPLAAIALGAGAVLLAAIALLAYRAHHRSEVLAQGLARARALAALDTAAGYREAADLLEPLAALDPLDAASERAHALAMLSLDYRAPGAEEQADALLVRPGRAEVVPPAANLALAVLALGRREAGTATVFAGRAGADPRADVLQARIALLAGNLPLAVAPASRAAAGEAAGAGALALQGDVLRRSGGDLAAARAAYAEALARSPTHPRAAYGLAKLALSGKAAPADAEAALARLLDARSGTPAPERGRAALHLAALKLRRGDRAGADAALDGARLDAAGRAWAARAAAASAAWHGPYRAWQGAPPALQSPSDDDPALPFREEPVRPAAPPPSAQPAPKAPVRAAAAAATKRTRGATRSATPARKAAATPRSAGARPAAKKGGAAKPAAKPAPSRTAR
jgi:hypothetical protein